MSKAAIARSLALALLRELGGFRGYPKDGENRFAEVLQESAVSVEHAKAVMQSFDGEFPTIREIRDTAMNLRAKFEREPDMRAEWEKQYGPPQPFDVTVPQNPIRRDDQLWRDIRKHVGASADLSRMSWPALAKIARELGYEDYARAWEGSVAR